MAYRASVRCQIATCLPTARVRPVSRNSGAASSRSAIRARRSASGAAPRANSENTASPSSPATVERRSQRRISSVSYRCRRRLWSSRSRSNRADGERPASSSASTAARCARSAAISSTTASWLASPSRASSVWMPRYVARIGLSTSRRRTRVSTRSYRRSSRGPGSAAGAGRGSSIPVSWSVIGPPAAAMRAGALQRWERAAAMSRRCPGIVGGQAALGAGSPAGCGAVSASAPATAWIVRSMSCAEIP